LVGNETQHQGRVSESVCECDQHIKKVSEWK
jgi:hypothetical protein